MKKKEIFLDYKSLIKSSLIEVIKYALKKTSEYGISNGHHFYITFDTTYSKNNIPEYLKKDYRVKKIRLLIMFGLRLLLKVSYTFL